MVKKPNLSDKEKEIISSISASVGKPENDVKEVFLGLMTYIMLNMYEGEKEFTVPYLFNFVLELDKDVDSSGVIITEKYTMETSDAFKMLLVKNESNQTTWLEDYFKSCIFQSINDKLL